MLVWSESGKVQESVQKEFLSKRKALEERVLSGRLLDTDKPSSKQVRLYISSAFIDTRVEKHFFREVVVPKLQQWCWHEFQLEFQIIDM